MALTWYPDFCPTGGCALEIERDWSAVKRVKLCVHHETVKNTNGMTDQQIFKSILQSSRVKEVARGAAKSTLGLPKDHPGLPFTVGADGNFTIQSGVSGQTRTAVRTAVSAAVASVEKPAGTSDVTVL